MERYIDAAKIRDDTPAQNTLAKRSITDEIMLSCLEASDNISAQSTASRKFPSAFLDELAAAVLDPTTGELLEYRHLLKRHESIISSVMLLLALVFCAGVLARILAASM